MSGFEDPWRAHGVQLGLALRYGFELEEGDFNAWGLGPGPGAVKTLAGLGPTFADGDQEAPSEMRMDEVLNMVNRTRSDVAPRNQSGGGYNAFHVLYVGAVVPKHSEGLVTQEISGLRRRGVRVSVATVRQYESVPPSELEDLAKENRAVYTWNVLRDATRGALRSPQVLACGLLDSLTGKNVPLSQRPRVMWECLAGLSLAEHVKDQGIDHVHAHTANTPTGVAMYAALALGVPFSFAGYSAEPSEHPELFRQKLDAASFVACESARQRLDYQRRAVMDEARLPIVRPGVAVPPRRMLSGHRDGILAIGDLVEDGGVDVLLDAVALFPTSARPHVTVVGDGPERAKLERQVLALGLDEHVRFYGRLGDQEIRNLFRRSAICVLASQSNPGAIPSELVQAMADGLPVIAGDLPAIRELVQTGENGILFATDDVFGLAGAIRDLQRSPELRQRLGAAARQRVLEEFALEPNLDRLIEAFQLVHDHPALHHALFATADTVRPSIPGSAGLRRAELYDADAPPSSSRKPIPKTAA